MSQSIDESLSLFSDSVADAVKSRRSVIIMTHMDCDGLVSGAIMAKAAMRAGARCTVTTAKSFSQKQIARLSDSKRDLHIITDLGSGSAAALGESLGDRWLVLDHHQIPDGEADNPRVINAWKYGMDGGKQICSGGMAYLAARSLDDRNEDLSALAVVAALGDRQDCGDKKSFVGRNQEIASTARDLGLVDIDLDLLLVGRETRPVADALAFTSRPFIDGLTWKRDRCLAVLQEAGIRLKDGSRWRVPAELSEDEKRSVIEAIAKSATGGGATGIMDELIGRTYTFPREDQMSFLRDGREFSTMLNSCGRMGRSGIGIAICMGDRNKMPAEGQAVLTEYRRSIRDAMNILSGERWRISVRNDCVMVNAEGVVSDTMTGTICSLMAGSPKYAAKIVVLRADGEDGTVKFSSRKSFGCESEINLSEVMSRGAAALSGIGGGHDAAAGASIAKGKLDEFLDYLEEKVAGLQGSDSAK